jgi:hypothetical protein
MALPPKALLFQQVLAITLLACTSLSAATISGVQNGSSSGQGTPTPPDGATSTGVFSSLVDFSGFQLETWTQSIAAPLVGNVRNVLFHSFFLVTEFFEEFAGSQTAMNVIPSVDAGFKNCCTPPLGRLDYSGLGSIIIHQGFDGTN